MISLLKRIFSSPEEKEEIKELKLEEIEGWVSSVHKTTINEDFEKIKDIIKCVSEKLDELEKVDIDKRKVELKLRAMTYGNKVAYINQTNSFLSWISPPEISSTKILEFCESFERKIESYNKRTIRNFFVMKNLIGEELDNIAISIKELDSTVKSIKSKVEAEQLVEYEALIANARKILKIAKEEKEGTNAIQRLGKEKEETQLAYENILKRAKELEESEKTLALKQLKAQKDNLHTLLLFKINELVNIFSPIQKAMKKMVKLEDSGSIAGYAEEPCKALINDEELKIAKILEELKENIEKNKIELKADKKYKTIESINKLKADYLKEWRESYIRIKKEIDITIEEIGNSDVEDEMLTTRLKAEDARRKIGEVESKINNQEKVDIGQEKEEIGNKIYSLTRVKVKVI